MRGPRATTTGPSAQRVRSGRGLLLTLLVISLAAILAAMWLLFGGHKASSTSADPFREAAPAAAERPSSAELETATRSAAGLPVASTQTPASPTTAPSVETPTRFSGRFVFEDGSIPPAMRFTMDAYPPVDSKSAREAGSVSPCHLEIAAETDDQARFAVEGLCAGTYTVRPELNALPAVEATVQVPATGARVVLSGYLLHLRMRAPDGSPAARSSAHFTWPRPPNEDGAPRTGETHAILDEQGEKWFGVPVAGTCMVTPIDEATLSQTIELSGPSRVVDVLIELRPQSRGAVLRVELRSCAPPGAEVQDYCIALFDPATGVFVDQMCSTDDRPWQTFPDLKPGRFHARAVGKYFGRPVFYRIASKEKDVAVELVDGRETMLRMCVDLGGRLSVLVNEAQATIGPPPDVDAQVEARREGDASPTNVSFRAPEGDGLRIGAKLHLGTELLSDNVLEPGTYTLTTRAPVYAPASQTVVIHAGETTRVTVVLQKQ